MGLASRIFWLCGSLQKLKVRETPCRYTWTLKKQGKKKKGVLGVMINVIKRDGEVSEFGLNKITEAIKKAFKATGKDYNNEILELLSLRVTADFQSKMKDGQVTVEQIQDSVEHVLEQAGYTDVAKAYIYIENNERKSVT